LINTSFDPGRGTGRSTIANSSAPSGWGATTAIIEEGMSATARLIDLSALWVNDSAMDLEDLFPSTPGDPLVELAKQDLDPMSIEELQSRIESLKAEIARVEAHMQRAQTHRSAAEELFKKT
jgi:uncharacterized small protein (DUF1192 family)